MNFAIEVQQVTDGKEVGVRRFSYSNPSLMSIHNLLATRAHLYIEPARLSTMCCSISYSESPQPARLVAYGVENQDTR